MSGVFGFLSPNNRNEISGILERMAGRLKLREWHATHLWNDAGNGVGLGQMNIGLFTARQDEAIFSEADITACVFGEFLNAEFLRQSLIQKGYSFSSDSLAELTLKLYLEHGDDLPIVIEGIFHIAIWDAPKDHFLLTNDRFGLLPVYYATTAEGLAFAPQVIAILQVPNFNRQLNLNALATFMRFQRLLGDETFFEGIHLLPYGSVLSYRQRDAALKIRHYWDFDRITQNKVGFEEAVEETGRLLREAVQKRLQGSYRLGVYLSGGLDSRTLLGFASQEGKPIPSVTYGFPASQDVTYARQIARRVGSENHFFAQPNGAWLKDFADLHLSITEGHLPFIHAHASISLEPARQFMDVNLPGYNGDQFLGGRAIDHAINIVNAPDDTAFLTQIFTGFNKDFSWPGITEAEEKLLYTPDYYLQLRDRAFDTLKAALKPYYQFPPPKRLDYFTTIHQGSRLSNLNMVYQRAFFEVRYPFCDNAFSEFVLSLPVDYRLHDRLYLSVITKEIPKVTWVPRDTDGLLPTKRNWIRAPHALAYKIISRMQRQFFPGSYLTQQLHGDPEDWLRNDLRDWAAGILFEQRTVKRGILNPAFVRSIYDRHMSGKEIWTIGKIAPLITFEMMMRKFFD